MRVADIMAYQRFFSAYFTLPGHIFISSNIFILTTKPFPPYQKKEAMA
jgi:hypothetical protein